MASRRGVEPISGDTVIVIPARLAATRLPGKPLADIHGCPMIVHVWRRAMAADVGPVLVAAADQAIADAILAVGGQAVLVPDEVPSGTDRVSRALAKVDPERRYSTVINLQGDFPTLDPQALRLVLQPLSALGCDLATLAAASEDEEERQAQSVVKAVISFAGDERRFGRALYFTRAAAPSGPGPLWHHIGIYAFRRSALEKFCRWPASALELREKLEQLRALENGMMVGVRVIGEVPRGVDTPADLERTRRLLQAENE